MRLLLPSSGGASAPLRELAAALGGLSPALAALAVVAITGRRLGLSRWLGQLTLWRIGAAYFLLALSGPPLLFGVVVATFSATGGASVGDGADWLGVPLLFAVTLPFVVFEELGWRGYLQPALQRHVSARLASVLVGLVWGFVAPAAVGDSDRAPGPVSGGGVSRPDCGRRRRAWLAVQRDARLTGAGVLLHASINAWAGSTVAVLSQPDAAAFVWWSACSRRH